MTEVELADNERAKMAQLPFRIYSPSPGGGRDWARLIDAGLVQVRDVGDDQETILLVNVTEAGRRLLAEEKGS